MKKSLSSCAIILMAVIASVPQSSCKEDEIQPPDSIKIQKFSDELIIEMDVPNDTKQIVSTGGIKGTLGYKDGDILYGDRISVSLYSYANLLSEMTPLLGIGLYTGIEVAENSSFSNSRKYYASTLDENNKYTIQTYAMPDKTFYWRAFLNGGNHNKLGQTQSYDMPSLDKFVERMSVETKDTKAVGHSCAVIPSSEYPSSGGTNYFNSGIAYTTDKSKLSADELKKAVGSARWTKYDYRYYESTYSYEWRSKIESEVGGRYYQQPFKVASNNGVELEAIFSGWGGNYFIWELSKGTTYYYCEYRYVGGYLVMGAVKEFTTKGYNVDELKKYVSATISNNSSNETWSVSFSSQLASAYPGKTFKYGVNTYLLSDDNDNPVWYNGGGIKYASGSGFSYYVTAPYPKFRGRGDDNDSAFDSDTYYNLLEKIRRGQATDLDREALEILWCRLNAYTYGVDNCADAFVEVDGQQYIIAMQSISFVLPRN